MQFSDFIADLGGVGDQCVSLIGKEQLSTIEAMRAEIESLRSQLKERDDYISILECSKNKVKEVEDTIADVISQLREEIGANEQLDEIENLDICSQIWELANFNKHDASTNVLASMLHGHTEFLTRLAKTPELQSLFLVSANTGKTFMDDTTRQLVLEQAARTSQLLAEFEKEDPTDSPFGDISEILDLQIDHERRMDEITELVETGEVNDVTVRALLLNEVTLSSALRRYARTLMSRVVKEHKEKKSLYNSYRELFTSMSKALHITDREYSPAEFTRATKRLLKEVESLRNRKPVVENTTNEWTTWSRKLYRSLTGTAAANASDIRMAIEEAALTSVGNSRLQKWMSSMK